MAIATALSKAAIAGYYQGFAAAATIAREQGVTIEPTFNLSHADPWAERYGDEPDETEQ